MITKEKYCNFIRFMKILLRHCLKDCKCKIIKLYKLIFCINPETKIMRNQHQENVLQEFIDNVQIKNIINNFDKYLKDYKNDGIVLSLKGHWGVGKTYFWHLYAKESLNQDKYIYISLFGINKIEEIKEKIINKISKKTNLFNKIKKFFGSSRIVGIHVSSVLSSMGIKNFKDVIICFDDFERMSPNLSMSEVLGFVSELKEQHACKIVLINNNNELKKLDELNSNIHFRKITQDKKEVIKNRYYTTKTNNHYIFNEYLEKIVDMKLFYIPNTENLINILKKNHEDKDFIDWNFIGQLFSQLKDNNKNKNLRLMQKFVLLLNLAREILEDTKIDPILLNEIYIKILMFTIERDKNKINEKFLGEQRIGYLNNEYFENLEETSILNIIGLKSNISDQEKSISQAQKDETKQREDEKYKAHIDKIYFDYLYGLSYQKEDFVKDMYRLLLYKKDIVYLLSISTFTFYVQSFLIELDKENEKYKKLYLIKMKQYIKEKHKYIQTFFFDDNQFLDDEIKRELEGYYHKLKGQDYIKDEEADVKKLIEQLLNKNGYNASQELLMSKIPKEVHKKNLIEDREYFEIVFKFMDWLNSFAGKKPFEEFYDNTVEIYKELYRVDEYKHKMSFVLNNFGIKKQELEKEIIENDK